MTKRPPEAILPAGPDVIAQMQRWLVHLGSERRVSPKTLDAYGRDVRQFLGFLTEHLGERPSLESLAGLVPADIRAFMARRRAEGLESRSLMRVIAGVRSFLRFLEREGLGQASAV